jgi:hypothetical protein
MGISHASFTEWIISNTKVICKALDSQATMGAVLLSCPQARLIVSLRGIEWI